MKRTLAATLATSLFVTPALAAPLHAGIQIDANSAGVLFGTQIDKTYSVEAHLLYSKSNTENLGISVDTTSTRAGLAGLARHAMVLNDVQPCFLFARVGAEFILRKESYYIPTSVTLTQPFQGEANSHKLRPLIGGGIELNLTKEVSGRVALDFIGSDRSINVATVMRF